MKLILRDDIANVGRAGETVTVAEGFGRNYLLPKHLALMATPANLKRLQQEMSGKKSRERRVLRDAETEAAALSAAPLVLTAQAGEAGKLFGTITSADIVEALASRGLQVDKRKIELAEPIKTLGTYTVALKVHAQVTATLTVVVEAKPAPGGAKAEPPHPENPQAGA